MTTLCLSFFMLGLIDAVVWPRSPLLLLFLRAARSQVRIGLVLLAGVGLAGATRQLRRCRSEATQAVASAAVLIASGVGASETVGAAVAFKALGLLVGGSIFLFATAWRTGLRLGAAVSRGSIRCGQPIVSTSQPGDGMTSTAPGNRSYAGARAVVVFDAVEGFHVPLRLSPPA